MILKSPEVNQRWLTMYRTGISSTSMSPMTGIPMPASSNLAQLQKTCNTDVALQGVIRGLGEPQNQIQGIKLGRKQSRVEGNPITVA
jgi:hypothetical protein